MEPNYRRCISCRKIAPKTAFWRIVRLYPSQTLQLDRGMGRSAYLCPQESCLTTARKKNRLGRSLKASVPSELYDLLWQRLAQSAPPAMTEPEHHSISGTPEVKTEVYPPNV